MQKRNFWLSREVILGLMVTILIAVPAVVLGGSKQIFVDKDNKGSQDGSSDHPYRSIAKALKDADEGDTVKIAKGEYKENITIPKGVKLSASRKDVTIKADNDDKPAVTMKHKTELNHITISGGRHGVRIEEDAKAKIFDVVIRKSNRDGIHVDSADELTKQHRVTIDGVEIKDNARTGIFADKRDIVIIESNIHDNGSDGIDLAGGTRAWLEDNRIAENRGSGLKATLDHSRIWTKSNTFRENKREGVEVNSYGVGGELGVKKATIKMNGRYGIAKVARTQSGLKGFGGLIIGSEVNNNYFVGNKVGNLSNALASF